MRPAPPVISTFFLPLLSAISFAVRSRFSRYHLCHNSYEG